MRHQPSLRREVIKALVHVVEEIITKAQDEQIQVSSRPNQPAPTVESAKKEEPETMQVEPTVEASKNFSQTMNEWNGFSTDKLQTLRDGLEKRYETSLISNSISVLELILLPKLPAKSKPTSLWCKKTIICLYPTTWSY
jgi:hypothetical protein